MARAGKREILGEGSDPAVLPFDDEFCAERMARALTDPGACLLDQDGPPLPWWQRILFVLGLFAFAVVCWWLFCCAVIALEALL